MTDITQIDNTGPLMRGDELLASFTAEGNGKYVGLVADIASLLAKIRGNVENVAGVPEKIETDQQNAIVAGYMSDLRTMEKRITDHRVAEKAPYLDAERKIDGFFGSLISERVGKAKTILQARGDDYTRRKEAQARAEREAAAKAERDRLAAIAAAEAAERQRAADAAAAAARARKPENIAAHEGNAAAARIQAGALAVDRMVQEQRAEEASAATLASAADLTRTKFETGHQATGKQVGYVEITDIEEIDLNLLRAYFNQDHVLSALKKYAAFHKHKIPQEHVARMAGATIEMRTKADYR